MLRHRKKYAVFSKMNKSKMNSQQQREYTNLRVMIIKGERQIAHDEQQRSVVSENRETYIENSIKHYFTCLYSGTQHDTFVVYRIVSLWFENWLNTHVNNLVNHYLSDKNKQFPMPPSYKFVPLVYQISARLNAANSGKKPADAFHNNVRLLLRKISFDHPHHCLYQILAL
eukprot:UN24482